MWRLSKSFKVYFFYSRMRQSKALSKHRHSTTNLRRDEGYEAPSPVKVTFFFAVEPEAEFGLFAVAVTSE